EAAQDAAEIAGIEAEVAAQLGCGRPLALRQLVHHPRLGERERALRQPLLQDADLPGVETVEAPYGSHRAIESFGHERSPSVIVVRINQIFDFVKFLAFLRPVRREPYS